MNAKLYYQYSKLDKKKQFALVADNVWIWYYVGHKTGIYRHRFTLYPYLPMETPSSKFKLLKEYNFNGCREIGEWISKRIISKL